MIMLSQRPLPDNTHNTHNRQMPMPLVGYKPTISAGKRLQTYALGYAATGNGKMKFLPLWKEENFVINVQPLVPAHTHILAQGGKAACCRPHLPTHSSVHLDTEPHCMDHDIGIWDIQHHPEQNHVDTACDTCGLHMVLDL